MMDMEGSSDSGVVEFGVVCLLKGSIERTESALCRPTGSISFRDQGVHGIGPSEASSHPPFSDRYGQFAGYRKAGLLAAHNRHAENRFLKSTWAVPPRVPDWRKGEGTAQEWAPWIDTLALYRALYPGLPSYALGDLVRLFQLEGALQQVALAHCPETRRRPHCALYDALASALLLLRLENEPGLTGRLTVGWLLEQSLATKSQSELF